MLFEIPGTWSSGNLGTQSSGNLGTSELGNLKFRVLGNLHGTSELTLGCPASGAIFELFISNDLVLSSFDQTYDHDNMVHLFR